MERHVKERLVGAAVLIAAAIILIPEMLSGPDRDARSEAASANGANGETPLKTYTIDLTKSPATQAAERAIDNRAPPAEVPATTAEPASAPQANPESAQRAAEPPVAEDASKGAVPSPGAAVAATPPTDSPPPLPAARQPAAQVAAVPRAPAAAPAASSPASIAPAAGAAGGRWAVQLGSFASRVTAERLVKSLQADGHDAFVMPVKSGQATLYRVRIGPMKDRESAAQTLRKVKPTAPGAAVVAHP